MQPTFQLTFHGIPHSDAIDQYVRARAEKLDGFGARVVGCRIVLEQPHRHSRHGAPFRVRIDVTVPGGELVADRVPHGDHAYQDVYAAIDAAFDDAARQLQDFVRRRRPRAPRSFE